MGCMLRSLGCMWVRVVVARCLSACRSALPTTPCVVCIKFQVFLRSFPSIRSIPSISSGSVQFSSVQFDQRPPDIRPSSTLTRTAPPHPHTGISTTDKPTPHVRFTPPPPPPPTNRPLNHLVLSPIDSSEIDHPTPPNNPPTGTVFSSFLLS